MVDGPVGAAATALSVLFLRVGEPATLEAPVPRSSPAPAPETAGVRWFLLLPVPADLANPLPCPRDARCDVPQAWRWEERTDLRGTLRVSVLDDPVLSRPGTHRILASPADPPDPTPEAAGLVEVVVRPDDSYVGFATELVGVPFVLNPAVLPDGRHQADARLGADCVALVIYGQRRLGRRVPYVAPGALDRFTTPVDGPVRAGDVLDFGFQTAILAEDRGVVGVLDGPDRILHTYHQLAGFSTFQDLPYADAPVTLRRWP